MSEQGEHNVPRGMEAFELDPADYDTEEEWEEALYQHMLANRND